MSAECELCQRPMPDSAYCCSRCARAAAELVGGTIGLLRHVVETIARQTATQTGSEGHRKPSSRPPGSLDASVAYGAAKGELETWARHILEERGLTIEPDPITGKVLPAAVLEFLAEQVGWLRYRPEAPEAIRAITDACKQIERIIQPPDHWYAGPCTTEGCGADLYPPGGATTIRCNNCGAKYSAEDRKQWLLDEAQEVWGNATWVAATLTILGIRCTDSMVRNYADRGRLASHPLPDQRGYPRYRLGSVFEIVMVENRARTERRGRKAIA